MHIQIDPKVLSRAIRACAIASFNPPKSARADDRPTLRGVLLQALRGGQLDVVGTDGRWLARWRMPARLLDDARPSGCIIEPASTKLLCAWLDTHSDEFVQIDVGPVAEARSERGSVLAFATRDADTFPRYEQVIPDYEHDMGAPVVGFDGALCAWLDMHGDDELVRINVGPVAEARSERGSALVFATRDADQYPRYELVIPDYEHDMGAPVVGFDGALLSEVVEAFRIAANAGRGRMVPLMFQFGAEAEVPVIVTCSSAPDMIAVVMPLTQPAVGQYSLTTERA